MYSVYLSLCTISLSLSVCLLSTYLSLSLLRCIFISLSLALYLPPTCVRSHHTSRSCSSRYTFPTRLATCVCAHPSQCILAINSEKKELEECARVAGLLDGYAKLTEEPFHSIGRRLILKECIGIEKEGSKKADHCTGLLCSDCFVVCKGGKGRKETRLAAQQLVRWDPGSLEVEDIADSQGTQDEVVNYVCVCVFFFFFSSLNERLLSLS
jgi:hypothetical protein